ncbi:ABC transporter ATP-binding protein [Streptomyces sp. DSM 41524]|uniref:ABC transporter ATP-binding protein n=1 Tax=Streptomyces asiaticus subsp. ignotus TaxID=3098222 RepID=A0ABU7QCV9_9ACTN|nr:ABC transporter ATP-binding protein [Streptomyces sp. DSM 41524]
MTRSRPSVPASGGAVVAGRTEGPLPRRTSLLGPLRHVALAGALAVKAVPGLLTVYVLMTLTTGALPVATAWLTKLTLDRLMDSGSSTSTLVGLAAGLAAVGVAAGVMSQASQYLRAEMDRAVGLLAQNRLFTAVNSFVGLGRFESPHFLDRLRLARQSSGMVPNQVVVGALGLGQAAVTISGFLGSLYVLSPIMTALVLAAGIPALVAELALSRSRAHLYWDVGPMERREAFYSGLLSSVEAAKEVRLYGIGAFLQGRMLADRRATNSARRKLDRREALVQSGLALFAALVSGGGLIWAVISARSGHLSLGDITIFIAAVAGVQSSLVAVAGHLSSSHQALMMFDHYHAVITAGPDLPVPASPRPLPALQRGIEFRDVWFRYSEEHPWVLAGVNLSIPHGKALALVGLNGSGKSTLVKLICRFYDPTRGAILWDGVDLRDTEPAKLRRRIGAVFQDYMSYDMTAAENIGLGDQEAFHAPERIRAAAERAGMHDELSGLPLGYDTLLSRKWLMKTRRDAPTTGVVLSGGQWQRLALARAFLRDSRDLMILDEPSAGLDAEAEQEIHTSLRRHRDGRTSLLISHRLGSLRDADVIVVLAKGRVVEQGNHRTLMEAGGEYARLFAIQANSYQSAEDDEPAATAPRREDRHQGSRTSCRP